eukprot:COSAG05_NODE_9067_length_649_cov_1.929091_1_plen_196_part_10
MARHQPGFAEMLTAEQLARHKQHGLPRIAGEYVVSIDALLRMYKRPAQSIRSWEGYARAFWFSCVMGFLNRENCKQVAVSFDKQQHMVREKGNEQRKRRKLGSKQVRQMLGGWNLEANADAEIPHDDGDWLALASDHSFRARLIAFLCKRAKARCRTDLTWGWSLDTTLVPPRAVLGTNQVRGEPARQTERKQSTT